MNRNVNEAESFAGDFVAPEEGQLFFEVPIAQSSFKGHLLIPDQIAVRGK